MTERDEYEAALRSEPWICDDVEVATSPIQGRGLFATQDLAAGTEVVRFGGRLLGDEAIRRLIAESETYIDTLSLDDDLNVVMPGRSPAGYGNHSCAPNLWWEDPLSLVTRRAVAAGSELTVDYGTITDDEGWSMDCACGASGCRLVVSGRDWEQQALQVRYGTHWVPGLRRRIRSVAID